MARLRSGEDLYMLLSDGMMGVHRQLYNISHEYINSGPVNKSFWSHSNYLGM